MLYVTCKHPSRKHEKSNHQSYFPVSLDLKLGMLAHLLARAHLGNFARAAAVLIHFSHKASAQGRTASLFHQLNPGVGGLWPGVP